MVDRRSAAALRRFGEDLDTLGAFKGLSWPDAKRVATEIAVDLTQSGTPGRGLFERARSVIADIMQPGTPATWDNPQRVYRAMLIAATLALSSGPVG